MARTGKHIHGWLLALAVTAAMAFGAQTALAGTGWICTQGLPPHSCVGQDPDFCDELCSENNHFGGTCNTTLDCCVCFD